MRFFFPRQLKIAFVLSITIVCAAVNAEAQLRLQPFASGFSMPVNMVQDPTNTSVFFVVEQVGRIRVVQDGTVLAQPLLDIRSLVRCCGESGLFGLAFPPNAAATGRFFIHYTNRDGNNVIARYKRAPANSLVADPSTRFDLIWPSNANQAFIPNPSDATNHNGGDLAFGSDGYLYIALGDGGGGNDPANRAQNPNNHLGKILRIDVSVADNNPNGYQVPADNPFVDSVPIAAYPEIWAFGLRNPWRFSFDVGTGGTGALIIADVGQSQREEINYEPAGAGGRNYGWKWREGALDYIQTDSRAYSPFTDPTYEYDHSVGSSITGGMVYRGSSLDPLFRGRYFYADFVTARLWSIGLTIHPITGEATFANLMEHTSELGGTGAVSNVSSFGRDANGELYIVQYGGSIMKLVGPTTRLVLPGDLNGDSDPDLLTQRDTGEVHFALNGGSAFDQVQTVYGGSTTWRVVGSGHFNGDLQPDIVWQSSTGSVVVWLMNGAAMSSAIFLYTGDTTWRVAAVADVNHMGSSDLIWQAPSGEVAVWLMQGSMLSAVQFMHTSSTIWRVVFSSDFNGDNEADLLWQHPSGAVFVWFMQGTSLSSGGFIYSGDTQYRVVGAGDVDGDGDPDVIWRSPTDTVVAWLMQGLSLSGVRYVKPNGFGWFLSVQP